MQHTKRVRMSWDLEPTGLKKIGEPVDSSGIWTVAMDWNGLSTIRNYAPFGLPENSTPVDDWDPTSLYGNVPHYFPLRAFVGKGTWARREAPDLPSKISLDIYHNIKRDQPDFRVVHFSIRGGPQLMLALGPRSSIMRWSPGYLPGGFGPKGASRRKQNVSLAGSEGADFDLPPARGDCDCLWVLFTEGGKPEGLAQGRKESFNFSIVTVPGTLQLDVWSHHLQVTSPEIREQKSRMPSWVELNAWSTELQ